MRVALYIRVSSDEQAKHGVSLNEQRHALLEYANQKKYNVVGIYADEGASASKKPQRRHEFQRMLRDCENGMIDLIVFLFVYKSKPPVQSIGASVTFFSCSLSYLPSTIMVSFI